MAETSIEWTDKVWNCVTGCTKVSQGCKNCYAKEIANRFFAKQYPPNADGSLRVFTDVRCHEDRLDAPLRWKEKKCEQCGGTGKKGFGEAGIGDCSGCGGKGKRGLRIFVNSMSDLFHEDVSFEFIDRVFAVMALCPQHTFQVLTKRPARMREYFEGDNLVGGINGRSWRIREAGHSMCDVPQDGSVNFALPLHNVWLGVSVEDRKTWLERSAILKQAPSAVRFISYEPALGPLGKIDLSGIHLVIVGGESGPGARPFNVQWARDVIAQCKAAGVPCFVKQLGSVPMEPEEAWRGRATTRLLSVANRLRVPDGFVPLKYHDRKGGDPAEWPADLRVREYPNTSQQVGG